MFPSWETYIPSDVCSPTWETHIPSDMSSLTCETHISSDMCSTTMVFVIQIAIFRTFFFVGNVGQKNVFYDILEQQQQQKKKRSSTP